MPTKNRPAGAEGDAFYPKYFSEVELEKVCEGDVINLQPVYTNRNTKVLTEIKYIVKSDNDNSKYKP